MQNTHIEHDFELTPAIEAHIDKSIRDIRKILPLDCRIDLFIKMTSDHTCEVVMKTRFLKHDLVSQDTDVNFYRALTRAKVQIFRQAEQLKDKNFNRRRRTAQL